MFRTNRKQQLLFVIAIAIWLLSGVFTTKVNDSSLEALGVEVEEQIAASADELDDAVIDALGRLSGNEVSEWELIEQLPKEADTYYLISDMAWSGQSPSLDAELPEIPGVSALQMPDGAYLHVHRAQGKHHIHGLRKVLDDPPYENRYLKKGASGNLNPPKGIALTRDLNGIVVRAPSGEPFIGINWSDQSGIGCIDIRLVASCIRAVPFAADIMVGLYKSVKGVWGFCRSCRGIGSNCYHDLFGTKVLCAKWNVVRPDPIRHINRTGIFGPLAGIVYLCIVLLSICSTCTAN